VVIAAERYAYMPSVGVAVLLGAVVAPRGALGGITAASRIAAVVVVAFGLGFASFGRSLVWANDATLSSEVARSSPRSPLAHQMRADVLLREGRLDEAIRSYERAASLDPRSSTVLRSLGRTLLRAGDPVSAARAFRRAIDAEPDWTAPRVDLAVACATTGDWACVEQQRSALRADPDDLARLDRILMRGRR
jgi:Tfp pilus assembly protein PilF